MANYDSAEITAREQGAADNLGKVAGHNAQSTKNQFGQQLENYDLADKQNRYLADVERDQNSRKAAADRFGQQKKMQSSVGSVLGSAGNALNGSSMYDILDMVRTRTDLDNNETWGSLQQNQNAVENAYNESLNQNVLNRNDAASNAEFGLRGIEGDTAAQRNNLNPNLFVDPGTGEADVGAAGYYDANKVAANQAKLGGYLMEDNAQQNADKVQKANKTTGNSYYDRLLNGYNQRS